MSNGGSKTEPRKILEDSYRDLCRLAEQVANHAERAPYPHVAERLRRIAQATRASADNLRAKGSIFPVAASETSREIKSGINHWQRMSQDLNDLRELETRLFERAALITEQSPESAELLRQIAASHRPHVEAFLDLIARADPQAGQT